MTSRLSTDTLNQMTPLLGSLARLIAGGVSPTEAQLQTLLLGADLEDEPGALEELKRWQRLLTVLQQQPTRENRQATVEALRLRGLPEAPVLLAVDLVMGSAPASSPAPPSLTASVERLDLGVLPPGQGATAELEVQGGPGQIVAESDLVWVTPQHFGPGPTRIRVEVRPMQSGVLWTTLRLITPGETLEVPVVAQWMEERLSGILSSKPTIPEEQPQRHPRQAELSRSPTVSAPPEQNAPPSASTQPFRSFVTAPEPAVPIVVAPPIILVGQAGWATWFKWVLATTIGWSIAKAVESTITGAMGTMAGFAFWALAGAASGFGQWLVLNHHFPQDGRWILASTFGWAVAWPVIRFVAAPLAWNIAWTVALAIAEDVIAVAWHLVLAMIGAIAGAVAGFAQHLVLRRYFQRARWWILASIVGWAVAWTVDWTKTGTIAEFIISRAIGGGLTGAVLVAILRRPRLDV